ncbi:integrase [Mesorhizobium sp. LNJC399B00]|nr:integrase [Mesorhizobium sp. LNJC399B00]
MKDATVRRFYYESHDQLRQHLADFTSAYNFGRRLKTLKGLTPYEFICKAWASQPERFKLDPLQQMPGLNIYSRLADLTQRVVKQPWPAFKDRSADRFPALAVRAENACGLDWADQPLRHRDFRPPAGQCCHSVRPAWSTWRALDRAPITSVDANAA